MWDTNPAHSEADAHGIRVRPYHADWASHWPCVAILPWYIVRPCVKVCIDSRGNDERSLSRAAAVGESRGVACCWYDIPHISIDAQARLIIVLTVQTSSEKSE